MAKIRNIFLTRCAEIKALGAQIYSAHWDPLSLNWNSTKSHVPCNFPMTYSMAKFRQKKGYNILGVARWHPLHLRLNVVFPCQFWLPRQSSQKLILIKLHLVLKRASGGATMLLQVVVNRENGFIREAPCNGSDHLQSNSQHKSKSNTHYNKDIQFAFLLTFLPNQSELLFWFTLCWALLRYKFANQTISMRPKSNGDTCRQHGFHVISQSKHWFLGQEGPSPEKCSPLHWTRLDRWLCVCGRSLYYQTLSILSSDMQVH